MQKIENLKTLFAGYLNQDFELLFGSADSAVLTFREHMGSKVGETTSDELMNFMKFRSEAEVADLLNQYGCAYDYPADWPSACAWLEHVQLLLSVVRPST